MKLTPSGSAVSLKACAAEVNPKVRHTVTIELRKIDFAFFNFIALIPYSMQILSTS